MSSSNRDREALIREIIETWTMLNEENRQRLTEKAGENRRSII